MCLAFFAIEQHPDFSVIIAANRDEFYARPTKAMHWWNKPYILAGQDLQAGGTWLALDKQANFAMVTNFREPQAAAGKLSRGELALNFLAQQQTPQQFFQQVETHYYAGFNMVCGSLLSANLFHFSNRISHSTPLEAGLHGLSNALLNTPWPKVNSGKEQMKQLCQQAFHVDDWFELLANRQKAEDALLPQTGIDIETEKLLSSRFIQSETYGTRCSTIIAVDTLGKAHVFERSFDQQGLLTLQQEFII